MSSTSLRKKWASVLGTNIMNSESQRLSELMPNPPRERWGFAKDEAMTELKWSGAEKKIARRAFDAALNRECAAMMAMLKNLAANAGKPEDIWAIHDYLTEQRKAIDAKYDYRYSQLVFVFASLLREKWIEEQDLEGLGEEKLQAIRLFAFG